MESDKQIMKAISTLRAEYHNVCAMQSEVIRIACSLEDKKLADKLWQQVERLDKTARKYGRMLNTMKKHYYGYYVKGA
jgi:hypothetical protein